MLELSKLIPQLYRRFDFELSHPEKEWTLHDYWFVKQTGLICKVKRREDRERDVVVASTPPIF